MFVLLKIWKQCNNAFKNYLEHSLVYLNGLSLSLKKFNEKRDIIQIQSYQNTCIQKCSETYFLRWLKISMIIGEYDIFKENIQKIANLHYIAYFRKILDQIHTSFVRSDNFLTSKLVSRISVKTKKKNT